MKFPQPNSNTGDTKIQEKKILSILYIALISILLTNTKTTPQIQSIYPTFILDAINSLEC